MLYRKNRLKERDPWEMQIKKTSWNPWLIVGTGSFVYVICLVCICAVLVGSRFTSSKDVVVGVVTPVPLITPIPLPGTIEEVKSQCANGECIQACLNHVDSEIRETNLVLPKYPEEDINLVYYGINDLDELDKPRTFNVQPDILPFQQDTDSHKLIWKYLKTLFPQETRPDLVTFGIYVSSKSDGKFDTTLTENWIMKINLLVLEDSFYLTNAVIHEYGHYLTLNISQRDESNICRQEWLHGCQAADSYLHHFYLKFWEDIYPELDELDWDSPEYEKELDLFYQKYKDRFINDYAATDPVEDIAETWAAFILEPPPAGNSIPEQKVNFFYSYPELVQLRYQIIKGICTFEQAQ